jgi:hypothetical protein
MMHDTCETPIRELNHRRDDSIDVTLFWNSQTNHLFVTVEDEQLGESFELPVGASDALEAFRHPYAYANRRRRDRAVAA